MARLTRRGWIVVAIVLVALLGVGLWLYLVTRPISCEDWQKEAQEWERTESGPFTDESRPSSGDDEPEPSEGDYRQSLEHLQELLETRPKGCGDPPLGI